jgi:hypothetical protein
LAGNGVDEPDEKGGRFEGVSRPEPRWLKEQPAFFRSGALDYLNRS